MPSEQVSNIAEESKWQKEMRERLNATIKSLEQGRDLFERAMRGHHNIRGPQDKKTELEESEEYDSDDSNFAENLTKRLSITRGVKPPSAKAFRPVDTPQPTARSTHLDRSNPGITENASFLSSSFSLGSSPFTGDTPTGSVFGGTSASTTKTPGTVTSAQPQPTQISPKPGFGAGTSGGLFGAHDGKWNGFGQAKTQGVYVPNKDPNQGKDYSPFQKVTWTSGNAQIPGSDIRTEAFRKKFHDPPLVFWRQPPRPCQYESAPITPAFFSYREFEGASSKESTFLSITLVQEYREWSFEELRLRDYKWLN
ncbi:hypothetical protein EX30DRAFT_175991 [Ascodesmis nigricans]|uniref:GED domain-containing protein n=1 Tax=Ascodesmis nigricans TaxID=341454 RepID=A0A4S2MQX9_9PEZI|nr:hypothetical protein EX30DRAFT_175991 [Ascodesmis nigricans]